LQRSWRGVALATFILVSTIGFQARAWNTPAAIFSGSKYTPWTWTGSAGDHLWTSGGNWCGAYVNGACVGQAGGPPAGATIVFNDACSGANCNATMPGGTLTIATLQMMSTYTGTITQGATILNFSTSPGDFIIQGGTFTAGTGTINVGTSIVLGTFSLSGGTFNGGSGDITVGVVGAAMTFSVTGGNFTSTSGNLHVLNTDLTLTGLSSFSANGGTITHEMGTQSHTLTLAGGFTFHSVKVIITNTRAITLANDFTMDGDLTLNCNSAGAGNLNAHTISLTTGNVYHTGYNVHGTTMINLTGTGTQTIDSSGIVATYTSIPGVELQQTSVAASMALNGNVAFEGGFSDLAASNLGSVNLNGYSVTFGDGTSQTATFTSDAFTFPTLTLQAPASVTTIGTLTVSGNLSITYAGGSYAGTAAGTIQVAGDVDSTAGNYCSYNVTLMLNGTGTQTVDVSGSTGFCVSSLSFNKTAGAVVLKNTVNGKFKNYGSYTLTSAGMAAASITMPTITDFYVYSNATSVYTSNGLQFPATANMHFASLATQLLADDMTVLGNLYFDIVNGTKLYSSNGVVHNLFVTGNIISTASGAGVSSSGSGSDVTVKLVGSGQTIDCTLAGPPSCQFPILQIASASGTTTLLGNIKMTNSYLYTSGTVDATGSSIIFRSIVGTPTITPGPTQFGNFTFNSTLNTTIAGANMIIKGTTTFSSSTATHNITGAIDAYGDVVSSGFGAGGAATLNLKGTNSNFTKSATIPTGLITVAKNAGQTVSLGSSVALFSGQSMSITGGNVDIASAAQTLTISGAGSLTLAGGTTVKLSGGTLSVSGASVPTGAYSGGNVVP
jgi:fibronectin-binding autotransporter adhesin